MANFGGESDKNLRLVTISVSDDSYWLLCRKPFRGNCQNCHVESGEVTSLTALVFLVPRGLCGSVSESQILDCSFSGAIETGYNSAGFVGFCWDSVFNCIVNAS